MLGAIFIFGYITALTLFASEESVAYQTRENSRSLFDNPRYKDFVTAHGNLDPHACPFAATSKDRQRQALEKFFSSIDVDSSGSVSAKEVEAFGSHYGCNAMLGVIQHRLELLPGNEGVTLDDFIRSVTSSVIHQEGIQALAELSEQLAPGQELQSEQKARMIFDIMNSSNLADTSSKQNSNSLKQNQESLSIQELGLVLMQYSLSRKDVAEIMRVHDHDGDGEISFDEFVRDFEPLWSFQFQEMRLKVKQLQRQERREAILEKQCRRRSYFTSIPTVKSPTPASKKRIFPKQFL